MTGLNNDGLGRARSFGSITGRTVEYDFGTHSNRLTDSYEVSSGEGTVIAGELTGSGEVSGDGTLAIIDEGIHNFIQNPVEQDVDVAGYEVANVVWDSGSSRPSSPVVGQRFFDTSLGQPIWFNGTDWVDAQGTTV